MAYYNIIQWNCQGIQANVNEVQIIANEFNINIFAYRKLLSPNKQLTFKHYTLYITVFLTIYLILILLVV